MQTLWVWLAALIEGEGCLQIRKYRSDIGNPCYTLHLSISNKSLQLLSAVREVWGGNIKADRRCSLRRGRNICYCWQLYSANVYNILSNVAPYVVFRGEQVRVAMQFQELRTQFRANRPITAELIRQYEWYRNEVSRLSGNGKVYKRSLLNKPDDEKA